MRITARTAGIAAIGVLAFVLGILVAAGLKFAAPEAASILGSFLGAVVAISGAIYTISWQEQRATHKVEQNLRTAIARCINYANGAIEELEKGDEKEIKTAGRVLAREIAVTRRLVSRHEGDNDRCLQASAWFEYLYENDLMKYFEEGSAYGEDLARKTLQHSAITLQNALNIFAKF